MIDTVLFDMGGTLEDIYVDDASKEASAREVLRILREKGIPVSMFRRRSRSWPKAGTATRPTAAPRTGS